MRMFPDLKRVRARGVAPLSLVVFYHDGEVVKGVSGRTSGEDGFTTVVALASSGDLDVPALVVPGDNDYVLRVEDEWVLEPSVDPSDYAIGGVSSRDHAGGVSFSGRRRFLRAWFVGKDGPSSGPAHLDLETGEMASGSVGDDALIRGWKVRVVQRDGDGTVVRDETFAAS